MGLSVGLLVNITGMRYGTFFWASGDYWDAVWSCLLGFWWILRRCGMKLAAGLLVNITPLYGGLIQLHHVLNDERAVYDLVMSSSGSFYCPPFEMKLYEEAKWSFIKALSVHIYRSDPIVLRLTSCYGRTSDGKLYYDKCYILLCILQGTFYYRNFCYHITTIATIASAPNATTKYAPLV